MFTDLFEECNKSVAPDVCNERAEIRVLEMLKTIRHMFAQDASHGFTVLDSRIEELEGNPSYEEVRSA